MHIAVAAVLAAADDAVLVARHLLKLGAHLVTARPAEEAAWCHEARRRMRGRGGDAAAEGNKQLAAVQQER